MVIWKEVGLANELGACLIAIGLLSELNPLSNDRRHLMRLLLSNHTAQAAIIIQVISKAVEEMANTPKRIPS